MAVTISYSLFGSDLISESVSSVSDSSPAIAALDTDRFAQSETNSTGSTTLEFFGGSFPTGGVSVNVTGTDASLATLDTGNYLIATQDGANGIRFAVYSHAAATVVAGTSLGDAGSVNAATAALTGGAFAIAYEDVVAAGNGDIEISFRNAAGVSTGNVIVDSTAANDRNPAIAKLSSGNVALAWQRVSGGATELWYAIYTAAGGIVLGPTLLDNTGTINRDASITALSDGGFLIAYEDNEYGGDMDIAVARVDAAGTVLSRIDLTQNTIDDRNPSLALLANDLALLSSTSDDGVTTEVAVRQYNPLTGTAGSSLIFESNEAGSDDSAISSVSGTGSAMLVWDNASTGDVKGQKLTLARNSLSDAAGDTITGDGFMDIMTGQEGADTLIGNGGDDRLDGGTGVDSMNGGAGNDMFYVDETYDATIEAANGGIDEVISTITHALRVNIERLTLQGTTNINGTGNSLDNFIFGNDGNNILNGLGGVDNMTGNAGNDTFYFDNASDSASESANEGIDIVRSSVSAGLSSDVEKLYLTGAAIDGSGNNLSNFIYGNANANTIDGDIGADRLYGYEGDDTYYVDSTGDLIFETIVGAAGGIDTVWSSGVNYTLSANVENLRFYDTSNAHATGNNLANAIICLDGNNYLYGRDGNDTLTGGFGIDQFVFDRAIGPANTDTITDFVVADDYLRLDDAIFTALSVGYLTAIAFRTGSAAADADDCIIYDSVTGAVFYDSDGTGAAAQIQFATLSAGLALANSNVFVF
ncbi:MAG: beta strand repeat-containing protein [Aestuariivirga sp.]